MWDYKSHLLWLKNLELNHQVHYKIQASYNGVDYVDIVHETVLPVNSGTFYANTDAWRYFRSSMKSVISGSVGTVDTYAILRR